MGIILIATRVCSTYDVPDLLCIAVGYKHTSCDSLPVIISYTHTVTHSFLNRREKKWNRKLLMHSNFFFFFRNLSHDGYSKTWQIIPNSRLWLWLIIGISVGIWKFSKRDWMSFFFCFFLYGNEIRNLMKWDLGE